MIYPFTLKIDHGPTFTQQTLCATTGVEMRELMEAHFNLHQTNEVRMLKEAVGRVFFGTLFLLKQIHEYVGWQQTTPPYLCALTCDQNNHWELHDFTAVCYKMHDAGNHFKVVHIHAIYIWGGLQYYAKAPGPMLPLFLHLTQPETPASLATQMERIGVESFNEKSGIAHRHADGEYMRWVRVTVQANILYTDAMIYFLIRVILKDLRKERVEMLLNSLERRAGNSYQIHAFLGKVYENPVHFLHEKAAFLRNVERSHHHLRKAQNIREMEEFLFAVEDHVRHHTPYTPTMITRLKLMIVRVGIERGTTLLAEIGKRAANHPDLHDLVGRCYEHPAHFLFDENPLEHLEWQELRDPEKALHHLQKAFSLSPGHFYVAVHIARIRLEFEQHHLGILALTTFLPDRRFSLMFNKVRYELLFLLYQGSRDFESARAAEEEIMRYKWLLSIDKNFRPAKLVL